MELLKELFEFAKMHKKMWLLPIIIIAFLLGSLIIFAQGSAIAPFIYAVF